MQQHAERFWGCQVISESVRELLRFRARRAQEDMLALTTVFPKLVSLELEFKNGCQERDDLEPTVAEAFLKVSGTLENLSVTTSPGASWSDTNVSPQLPNLDQMATLKHLRTESIWLFGRGDSFVALQLLDILPISLVHFHLIDYWGSSDINTFYPQFPSSLSLFGFYDQAFSRLYESCSMWLPNLKGIKLSLHSLSSDESMVGSDNTATTVGKDLPADISAFLRKFQKLFASVGVQFSVLFPETVNVELHSSWANVGLS